MCWITCFDRRAGGDGARADRGWPHRGRQGAGNDIVIAACWLTTPARGLVLLAIHEIATRVCNIILEANHELHPLHNNTILESDVDGMYPINLQAIKYVWRWNAVVDRSLGP